MLPAQLRDRARFALARTRRRAMRAVDDPYVGIRLTTPLVRPYWRMRFHTFGQGAVVHKPYWLHGARQMAIGDEAFILRAWLTVDKSAWGQPDPALRIGARTTVFPGTMVGAKESLVIEEDVSIGAYCLIVDYEHRVDGPHDALARNPLEASPVRIGRGSSIAQRTAVLRGSTIGRYCFIGTNSVVHGDIPDYAIAAGAPARIIGWTRGHVPAGDPEGEEQ